MRLMDELSGFKRKGLALRMIDLEPYGLSGWALTPKGEYEISFKFVRWF